MTPGGVPERVARATSGRPRPLRPARVRVPCSTSNLGAGFDTLGLALTRYLEAAFEPGGDGLRVERFGTLKELDLRPERDLLVRTFLDGLASAAPVEGALRVTSEIPLARGLGSSAAARVAGHALARAARGLEPDREAAFLYAMEGEGHGDNAAPCALGGFRAVVPTAEGPRAILLELAPSVGFAYAAPSRGVSTAEARAALPATVPHATAVEGLGRITALLQGLAEADPELVRAGVEDALHVPFRLPLIRRGPDAVRVGYEAGAWGVTISGAGSGLIAICAPERAAQVAEAMRAVFAEDEGGKDGAVGFALEPDMWGLDLEPDRRPG